MTHPNSTATPATIGDQAPEQGLVLTLSCPNRKGIVHAVTGALLEVDADITESQQFDSPDTGTFFMRVEFHSPTAVQELSLIHI